MNWLANLAYGVAAVLYLPILLYQMLVQGKNRRGWRERCGYVTPRSGDNPCVWVHAVSLGEVNATRTLIAGLRQARPSCTIVVSTTTDTGYARARQLYPDLQVFRYPLDFSWVIRRVLRRIRPDVIVLMELELWYNLVTIAARRGVHVCIANGRFTERSSRRAGIHRQPRAADVRPVTVGRRPDIGHRSAFRAPGCGRSAYRGRGVDEVGHGPGVRSGRRRR